MKKVVLLIVMGIFLTGCQKKVEVSPIKREFSAGVKCGEEVYRVTCSGTGILCVNYDKPEQLQGLGYRYQGEQLTVKYGALQYIPCADLPENAVSQLHDFLIKIDSTAEEKMTYCDEVTAIYTLPMGEVVCSTEDGTIQKIHIKQNNRIYEFFQ
ncbi:MAG: hypothetical protein IJU14_02730 [Clostridia bacterium]|nr:hypothetical protein [Clostridia bacterium]